MGDHYAPTLPDSPFTLLRFNPLIFGLSKCRKRCSHERRKAGKYKSPIQPEEISVAPPTRVRLKHPGKILSFRLIIPRITLHKTLPIALAILVFAGCSSSSDNEASRFPRRYRGDAIVNPVLVKHLKKHGLSARESDGWVIAGSHPPISGSVVQSTKSENNSVTVQIDVRVHLEDHNTVIESFAGTGQTKQEAIKNATDNFAINALPVLLASLYSLTPKEGHAPLDGVEQREWYINGEIRKVTVGGFGVRGFPPGDSPPTDWFKQVENEIKVTSLSPGTHWVRCYFAQFENKPLAYEALLDNEPWERGQSILKMHRWPPGDDFYSVRVFLVIQDADEPTHESLP